MSDLAIRDRGQLARSSPEMNLDLQLIKDQLCPTASDGEVKLFGEVCRRLNLDPLKRQIYAVMRWDARLNRERMVIQVGIDGMRAAAARTGKYRGQVGPLWCAQEGDWVDLWRSNDPPYAAKVGIIRSDFPEVLWATVLYRSFVQTNPKTGLPSGLWGKMPEHMLAKCATNLALKTAFPDEFAGIDARPYEPDAETAQRALRGGYVDADAFAKEWAELVRGTVLERADARNDFIGDWTDGASWTLEHFLAHADRDEARALYGAAYRHLHPPRPVDEAERERRKAANRAAHASSGAQERYDNWTPPDYCSRHGEYEPGADCPECLIDSIPTPSKTAAAARGVKSDGLEAESEPEATRPPESPESTPTALTPDDKYLGIRTIIDAANDRPSYEAASQELSRYRRDLTDDQHADLLERFREARDRIGLPHMTRKG